MTSSALAPARRGRALLTLLLAAVFVGLLLWGLRDTQSPPVISAPPASSESVQVDELLASTPEPQRPPVIIVASRDGASSAQLRPEELAALAELGPRLAELAAPTGAAEAPSGPIPSESGAVALLLVPMDLSEDNTVNAETIAAIRAYLAEQQGSTPDLAQLKLEVTGGPAFGADIASAFDGANFTLLAVTVIIVAVLLILTYRSPVLWLVPITIVAVADRVAALLAAKAAEVFHFDYNTGILSVLVFGAGSNYALLLISRYREELATQTDHGSAIYRARSQTLTAILASNLSVVIALLMLGFATIPATRGLGFAAAIGLLVALAAIVLLLPPALELVGRKAFWPAIPQVGSDPRSSRLWTGLAQWVAAHKVAALSSGLAVLVVMASGLLGASIGLSQTERFRVPQNHPKDFPPWLVNFPPDLPVP